MSPLSGVRLNMASLPATLGLSPLFFKGLTNHLHVSMPMLMSTSQGTSVDTVRQLSTVADCFVLKYLLPFLSCKRVIHPCLLPWHPLASKMCVEVGDMLALSRSSKSCCEFPPVLLLFSLCHEMNMSHIRAGPQNEDDI